jgi:hypothetical protein
MPRYARSCSRRPRQSEVRHDRCLSGESDRLGKNRKLGQVVLAISARSAGFDPRRLVTTVDVESILSVTRASCERSEA